MELQTFELGGFFLQHPNAQVDVAVQTTIDVPRRFDDSSLDAVVKSWVQRGRVLSLRFEVEAGPSRLSQEQSKVIIDALVDSEVFCQSYIVQLS